MGHEATAGGLEIEHQARHRGSHLLITNVHVELDQGRAQLGQLTRQFLQALVEDRLLAKPVGGRLLELPLHLLNLVALLQELQLGGGPFPVEGFEALEHFTLQHQRTSQHGLLGGVEFEGASQFGGLELKLLLLVADRFTDAALAIEAGFGIEAQQHLALLHPIPLLDQNRLHHPTHRHLHILDHTQGLQLAGHGDDLLGFCQGQPSQRKGREAHEAPGDPPHPYGGLLQHHRFRLGSHPALQAVLGPSEERKGTGKPAHQGVSCWRDWA